MICWLASAPRGTILWRLLLCAAPVEGEVEAEVEVGSSKVSDVMVCLRDRRRAVDAAGMMADEEERGGSAASARGNGKGKFGMSSGSSKMPL